MSPGRAGRGGAAVVGGFLLVGVVSVLLGPAIPELRARWQVSNAQAASLFVAQFTGSCFGAVIASFRLRRSLVGGYGLIAAGLAGMAGGGWPLARPAMALTGLGLGLAITASNLYVAHANFARRGAALSILNLIWGLGAMGCPLLFAALRELLPLPGLLALLGAVAGLACAALAAVLPPEPAPAASARTTKQRAEQEAPLGFLFTMACMLFLYVGSETAVGGWLVTLSDELGGDRSVASLFIGSGFWGALLLGRAVTPWLLRLSSEATLYRLFLTLAAAGALLLVLADSRPLLAAGALIAGLGMAPLFPLTVSILAAATAATRSRTSGWVLACGGLGGAALPWLTARLSSGTGALQRGFLVPLLALVGLAGLRALQRLRSE